MVVPLELTSIDPVGGMGLLVPGYVAPLRVTVAVPLTAQTRGMIGTAQLRAMPPGGLVINIARGAVIDYAALLGTRADLFGRCYAPACGAVERSRGSRIGRVHR